MASTRLGYLAVKKETTAGVAVIPSHFLRYKTGDIKLAQTIIANNPIQNNRWNPLNAVAGKIETKGTYDFDLDVREAGFWLYAALGSISSTDISSLTDASVYRHTLTVGNILPTLTLEQGKGNLTDTTNNRQNYAVERSFGVYVDKFVISASDGIASLKVDVKALGQLNSAFMLTNEAAGQTVLKMKTADGFVATDKLTAYDTTPQSETLTVASVDMVAITVTTGALANSYTIAKAAKLELQPLTPSYTDAAKVFSFVHATFYTGATLAAATIEAELEKWDFTYENQLEERYGSLRASPSVIAPKGAKAILKFDRYFNSIADRDNYLRIAKTGGKLVLDLQEIVSATDTLNQTYQIVIEMNDLRFTTYDMPTGTDALYSVNFEATCFYDATDGQSLDIKIYNNKAGTTYTA